MPKTVVIGMSGGVDSSVSALLLKQQGYRVIGLFMKNWEEVDSEGVCQAAQEYEDVQAVCQQIDIPYYTVNFVQDYQERVFNSFLKELKAGNTPNPDILCNREIKFSAFFSKAMEIGADYLATGHYCQVLSHNDSYSLARGLDENKDQSYFLYTTKAHKLRKTLFPVGHLNKSTVRQIAIENRLPTATKKESMGICFIGKRNFKQFVHQYIAYSPGNFETLEGEVVGRHDGVAYYTIGQRRGLGIGGPGQAWFVVKKDIKRNVIVLAQGADHPALYHLGLIASEINWINPIIDFPLYCSAKVRYRQKDVDCRVFLEEGRLKVFFEEPVKAITPKQSIVFYRDKICLGGAVIERALDK